MPALEVPAPGGTVEAPLSYMQEYLSRQLVLCQFIAALWTLRDAITTAMSLYIVHEARQLGAPRHVILRMVANVMLDGIVGAVPVVGDAFDVLWRANRRNMRLLQNWLEREGRA